MTATLPAQVKSTESPAIPFATPTSHGCPIAILAERRSPVAISSIESPASALRTQAIHLRFYEFSGPKIAQATVVVHGLSQKSRFLPMDTGPTSDVDETFRLAKNEQATSLAASYLRPERVFITQWIELKDVAFTDGSNWRASRAAQCTVTPDNFILVRQ